MQFNRERRQAGGHQPGMLNPVQAHDPVPSPSVSASRKKQKIAPSLPPQSFGGPSPSFHQQTVAAANQPSSSVPKRGPMMSSKSKKNKSVGYSFMSKHNEQQTPYLLIMLLIFCVFISQGQLLPGTSSMKMQYPSSGQTGRNQIGNRVANEPAEAGSLDPLVGRRVRTRWPDDNNFYEAVITDYNPLEVYPTSLYMC